MVDFAAYLGCPFHVGQVVSLRNHPHVSMVVSGVSPDKNNLNIYIPDTDRLVQVVWLDEDRHVHRDCFPPQILEAIKSHPAVETPQ